MIVLKIEPGLAVHQPPSATHLSYICDFYVVSWSYIKLLRFNLSKLRYTLSLDVGFTNHLLLCLRAYKSKSLTAVRTP